MTASFKPEEKLQDIIQAYGKTMQETDGASFYDVKILPYPKDEILKALLAAIKLSDDVEVQEHLKAGLISLSHFRENIGDEPVKPFDKDLVNETAETLAESLKDDEWKANFEKYNDLLAKANTETAFYMESANKLNKENSPHDEFIGAWKNGKIKIDVDRSKALRAANSDSLPKRYRAAHVFWSTVWLLTIPLGIGLVFYKWWVGLLILFVASPVIANATKTSAMQFMIDYALESEDFYNHAINEGIIRVSEKL